MIHRLTLVASLLISAGCDPTVIANSPESVPPTPPALLAGIEPLSRLNAHYFAGVPGESVRYPIDTRRTFLIFQPTLSEERAPGAGAIAGERSATLRFTAQDSETGISSLSGEIVFQFECLRASDDGTTHSSDLLSGATLTRAVTTADTEPMPVTQTIDIEFSGNMLWREGGCDQSSGPTPFRRGSIFNVRARYSARALNGSAMRGTLPRSISGEFRIPVAIHVNLER